MQCSVYKMWVKDVKISRRNFSISSIWKNHEECLMFLVGLFDFWSCSSCQVNLVVQLFKALFFWYFFFLFICCWRQTGLSGLWVFLKISCTCMFFFSFCTLNVENVISYIECIKSYQTYFFYTINKSAVKKILWWWCFSCFFECFLLISNSPVELLQTFFPLFSPECFFFTLCVFLHHSAFIH